MLQYDLIIVGGGASGLAAGIEALKNGVKKVMILERNSDLGGNLNLFIHVGFGRSDLNENVTGPEFASILIEEYKSLGGEFKLETEVLEVSNTRIITLVNPINGVIDIEAKAIILASGRREKFTGNIVIPIHKYIGVFSLVAAHKLVNLKGYLPGNEIVIVGKNKWSLLLARRLIIEGANVKAVIDNSSTECMTKEEADIICGFNIDIIYNSEVIELLGNEKIEMVNIMNKIDKSVINIECDSLILTVGHYPELAYIRNENIVLDYETSIKGIYACGTILNGEIGGIYSYDDGKKVGKIAAEFLK